MENLSMALRAMFSQMSGDDILKEAGFVPLGDEKFHLDTQCEESTIVRMLLRENGNNYSIDQLSMIGQVVNQKWIMPSTICLPFKFYEGDSVFNMPLHFSTKMLIIKDGEPVCRYSTLLRWHLLTVQLGEDLFTTSFLASHDIVNKFKRKFFDWDAYLKHDCKELNALFLKPMAELHIHLKGSSYNVDISWICLMCNVLSMRKVFENIANSRQNQSWNTCLYEKVRNAAVLRFYLSCVVGCHDYVITKSEMTNFLNHQKPDYGEDVNVPTFDECLKKCYESAVSKAKKQGIASEYVLDYIPVEYYEKNPVTNFVMASERRFMYECYRYIYSGDCKDADFPTLFYAYLTYKDDFRHMILQLNSRVGFANFANYEELKSEFILKKYYPLLYKAAIEGFINNTNNRYIEARIVPKDSSDEISKSISEIYRPLKEESKDKCSIIFHFIKKRDETYKNNSSIRHSVLRAELKKKAFAIYSFRKEQIDPELVGRVVGIDAANSEIFARPEVFAQAFRFLRGHEVFPIDRDCPYDLNITYHVGEDFLDVADGLRAVEEAIVFLGLRNGDRLGHALALGTDVRAYYAKRYHTICESKQVILDNLAWLHHKCIKLKGSIALSGYLEMMFHKYFRDLYDKNLWSMKTMMDHVFSEPNPELQRLDNIRTYYLSWLLRGNSPTFGADLSIYNEVPDGMERRWIDACMNQHVVVEMACQNADARELYDMYHSKEYADKSSSVDSFTVPSIYREDYYDLLEKIQEDLMNKIEKKHIAIECNPSSNYKIGEIERYDQHPILRFFNYGIDTPYPSHNITVSINTDDQGVFSTSLEREYSLIALAMERNELKGHTNSPRAVIDWLNQVREMAIEQRFDMREYNND